MADPELQIRWGAGGGGEGRSEKNFFSAPRASVWFKNKETAWVPRVPSLEPPLDSKVSQQF